MIKDLNLCTHFWVNGFQDHRIQPDSANHTLRLQDFLALATSFFPLLMRMDAAKTFRLGLNIYDTGLNRTSLTPKSDGFTDRPTSIVVY